LLLLSLYHFVVGAVAVAVIATVNAVIVIAAVVTAIVVAVIVVTVGVVAHRHCSCHSCARDRSL